jgi:hypothetical protein
MVQVEEEVEDPREESRLLQPWWFDRREQREGCD